MPFTISHAAVATPFSRILARWRLLSAVLIGTMVPDFGVFLPWRMHRFETHSASSLLTFCLPVGLCSYWIFQYLIKTPALEILPDGAYARWRPYSSPADIGNLAQWMWAAIGVLAGAVTHLVWDAFTHDNARGVRMIPWLEDPLVEIGNHHMVGVHVMQDLSSVIGLAVVVAWVFIGLRRGHDRPIRDRLLRKPERRVWVALYTVAVLSLSFVWLWLARGADPMPRPMHLSVTGVATVIAVAGLRGLASGFLLVSLALDARLGALRAMRGAALPP